MPERSLPSGAGSFAGLLCLPVSWQWLNPEPQEPSRARPQGSQEDSLLSCAGATHSESEPEEWDTLKSGPPHHSLGPRGGRAGLIRVHPRVLPQEKVRPLVARLADCSKAGQVAVADASNGSIIICFVSDSRQLWVDKRPFSSSVPDFFSDRKGNVLKQRLLLRVA